MVYTSSGYNDLAAFLFLEAVQFGAAVIWLMLYLLALRRPELYLQGHAVDRQYTTSLLGRWTFGWVNGLLSFAKSNKCLNLSHLPRLHLGARSEYLHGNFTKIDTQTELWKVLAWAHSTEVLFQILLAVMQAAAQFLPTYAMYRFLELLEPESGSQSSILTQSAWILGLGISLILTSSVETWLYWIVCQWNPA